MSTTSKTKKVLAAGLAAVIAASTAMAGTLAWQSLNQEATNVLSGVVNPGGRLHDDFDGDANKDIYVENFGTQKIYARIMLSEFLAKADGITVDNVDDTIDDGEGNSKPKYIPLLGETYDDTSTYTPYNFSDGGIADRYWKKLFGNEEGSAYLPTYNMNQDSLAPDLNGYNVYEGFPNDSGVIGDANGEEWRINDGSVEIRTAVNSGTEYWDADVNKDDENKASGTLTVGTTDSDESSDYLDMTKADVVHPTATTGTATVISMEEWQENPVPGPYWVYDGVWAYWAQAIEPGYDDDGNPLYAVYDEESGEWTSTGVTHSTGHLLTGLEDLDAIDEDYVYAIHVTAQFVTKNDLGSAEDGTGFFDLEKGSAPSEDAMEFLEIIGAISPSDENSEDTDELQTLYLTKSGENSVTIQSGDSIYLTGEDGADLSSIYVDGSPWDENSEWSYDADTGILTIYGTDSQYTVFDNTNNYSGTVYIGEDEPEFKNSYISLSFTPDYFVPNEPETFTIEVDEIVVEDVEMTDVEKVSFVLDDTYELPNGNIELTDNNNGTATLVVPAQNVYTEIGVTATYSSYTDVTATAVIDDTPTIGSKGIYDDEGNHLGITYTPGTETFVNLTTYFFAEYTGTVQPIKDAMTGKEADILNSKVNYYLCYLDAYGSADYDAPTEIDGVTLTPVTDHPEKVKVTISSDYSGEAFAVVSAGGGGSIAFQLKPTGTTESDTTAPTVDISQTDTYQQTITISKLTNNDFPLKVTFYAYSSKTLPEDKTDITSQIMTISQEEDTISIEKSELWGHEICGNFSGIQDMAVWLDNDQLTILWNYASSEEKYLHVIATDAVGNASNSASLYIENVPGCFVAGTQIQTPDGLVNVEDIRVGDTVYSMDLTTGEIVEDTVAWVQEKRYIDATYTIYAGNEIIETTYEHPFYVSGKWVATEDLKIGDKLMCANNTEVEITDISYTELDSCIQVYNFTVENTHNYLITQSGILVHNIQK